MNIKLIKAGKRYQKTWVFRNIDLEIPSNQRLAILGANGSGKSTLLKMLSGALSPTEGKVVFVIKDKEITPNNIHKHISIAAPYIEIIEEFDTIEMFRFHEKFKPFLNGFSIETLIENAQLDLHKNKKISELSSGLKQRLKLALAIFSHTPLLLLDEPATNLDQNGIDWFNAMMDSHCGDRIVVICSNHNESEFRFCEKKFNLKN